MSNEVSGSTEIENVETKNIAVAQLITSDDIDYNLAMLVNIVNDAPGTSIGVTLTVHGTLISGLLISGKEYFEYLAAELGKDSNNPLSMALSGGMERISQEDYGENIDRTGMRTAFIHLKNAQHILGGEFIPQNGTYWRGKLCDVSGFTFGNMSRN